VALPDLASVTDLSTRGVESSGLAVEMLAVASSIVRGVCQSPILETTSTVTLWTSDGDAFLDLPGKPVTAVSSVVLDGTTLDTGAYRLVHGRLWRAGGWGWKCDPRPVVVTLTHGFAEVPPEVRQLVCDLAIAGMNAAADGARVPGVVSESIDDYTVSFAQGAEAVATAMELPRATRLAFRRRFGGGAALVAAS
jgi:hypothetical protein